MIIETQIATDQNIMNFFIPVKITGERSLDVIDETSPQKSPLAEKLFEIEGIVSLLISPDMISVTKEDSSSWEDIKPQVLAEIMDFVSQGNLEVVSGSDKSNDDVIKQILGLIDARIRPAIMQDGGDIEFKMFEDGVVYVELQGNCVGCAYAMVTLKEGVEKLLKLYIPEVKEVRSIDRETN